MTGGRRSCRATPHELEDQGTHGTDTLSSVVATFASGLSDKWLSLTVGEEDEVEENDEE